MKLNLPKDQSIDAELPTTGSIRIGFVVPNRLAAHEALELIRRLGPCVSTLEVDPYWHEDRRRVQRGLIISLFVGWGLGLPVGFALARMLLP